MNVWLNKRTPTSSFAPIKVIDIELTAPLPPLDALGDYGKLLVLVRLHGRPLGNILSIGSCSAPDLQKAILEKLSGLILRQLLFDRLAVPLDSDRFCIEDLIKWPHPNVNCEALPLVTVAVCTRNRAHYLPLCLEALNNLHYPYLDLLVVDNAPRSNANERFVRANYPNIRYVREPRPGLNWARNRAIIESLGEILAYTDDDCVVDSGWIQAIADDFVESPETMAVTGLVVPYELETEAQVLFERKGGFGKGFKRKWYPAYSGNGKGMGRLYAGAAQFGTGANMAFRRTLFDRIGYFDPALDVGTPTRGGGDLEMFFRLLKGGGVLLYEPKSIVRHRHRRNISELRTQMADFGIGFISYLIKSGLVYPDERSAFIRKGLGWLWYLNIRRPLESLMDPFHLPWNLILAEAIGSLTAPIRYWMARSAAARLEDNFGPLIRNNLDPLDYAKENRNLGRNIGMFHVELGEPLPVFSDASDYGLVRFIVNWRGRPLGRFEIANCYKSITTSRLREAIVDHLGLRLLDLEVKKSLDGLRIESYAALSHHYLASEKGI
jgi:O-antigen biosynthesis protein